MFAPLEVSCITQRWSIFEGSREGTFLGLRQDEVPRIHLRRSSHNWSPGGLSNSDHPGPCAHASRRQCSNPSKYPEMPGISSRQRIGTFADILQISEFPSEISHCLHTAEVTDSSKASSTSRTWCFAGKTQAARKGSRLTPSICYTSPITVTLTSAGAAPARDPAAGLGPCGQVASGSSV